MKYRVASFFAGVGGIDLGFEKAKFENSSFETVYANEIDRYAADTFEMNFDLKVDCRDIHEVNPNEIPDFDILIGGFPCQAFSIAGYQQGFDDDQGRGDLFFELIRIMKEKRPRVALFENVKNLVGHDSGNTFRIICEELDSLGYQYEYKVLNACEYGNVPQNRERIYIVAFKEQIDKEHFSMPLPIELTNSIRNVIDFSNIVDEKYYYSADKCKFYDILEKDILNHNSIYQWRRKYVRENKSNVVPTLTANMGTGGHNVPLILTDDNRIRKLTPLECFRVQGFPKTFTLPEQSNARLYKQAGNSVVVPVIERIAVNILNSLVTNDTSKLDDSKFIDLVRILIKNGASISDINLIANDDDLRKQKYLQLL